MKFPGQTGQVSLAALHGKNSGSRSPAHSLTAAMAACERSRSAAVPAMADHCKGSNPLDMDVR